MHQSKPQSAFPALFQAHDATIRPGKPFLVGPTTLAWGVLFDRMARTATLFGSHGLRRGERILIASADDEAVITLFLASLRLGTTAVILDPRASADELARLLPAADARLLLMDCEVRRRAGRAAAAGPAVIAIGPVGMGSSDPLFNRMVGARRRPTAPDTYPSMLAGVPPLAEWPQDIPQSTAACILPSPGTTTSQPVWVEITHRALFAEMATFVRRYGLGPQSRLLNVLPLHEEGGLTQGAVATLVAGATLHRPSTRRGPPTPPPAPQPAERTPGPAPTGGAGGGAAAR